jgi:hypothetical protein
MSDSQHTGAPLLSALGCAVAARLCTGQVQAVQLLARQA